LILTIIINSKLNCILPTVMNGGVFRKYETRVHEHLNISIKHLCVVFLSEKEKQLLSAI
jgi:hypothetical protein